jgi:Protein of unknown function (DUF2939)
MPPGEATRQPLPWDRNGVGEPTEVRPVLSERVQCRDGRTKIAILCRRRTAVFLATPRAMRWVVRAVIVIPLLWAGYAAWPFWAVYDLINALQNRDAAALAHRVNFPAVRRSLTEQVVSGYLQLSGKDARLGQFARGTAVAAVASVADPIVAKLISAEALIELLHTGWPGSVLPDGAANFHGLGSGSPGNVWQLFVRSEQGLRSWEFPVPVRAPPSLRFRLQFRLTNWVWKLSAIELPEELRLRLAQELVKQIDRK